MKITDMQAAVGCAQLKKLPSFVERRKKNFRRLYERLKDLSDTFVLPEACPQSRPSWFGFLLTCRKSVERERVVSYLEANGVQTRMLFAGNLVKHPCFDEMRASEMGYRIVGDLTNTNRIMRDTFWVGVYPGMTEDMIDYMAEIIHEAVR